MKGIVALQKKPKSLSFIKLKNWCIVTFTEGSFNNILPKSLFYEGWNFDSGNYLFTTDTK